MVCKSANNNFINMKCNIKIIIMYVINIGFSSA